MNAAENMFRIAVEAGVEVCFANPGTTEMPLVAALDAVPRVRAVLGLFEGVCTGAADGYARMAERPAMTLLHLGPGLANGLANLHNARRARSPLLNVVGDQATWHAPHDAPLTADIESLASPVSGWVRTSRSSHELAVDFSEALAAARQPPGGVATLIVPADCQWGEAGEPVRARPVPSPDRVPPARVADVAERLRRAGPAALLLGGCALRQPSLQAAWRVSAASGARLLVETFPARVERGRGLPRLERLPYFPEQASARLSAFETIVLVGAREPVAFFGYRDGPTRLVRPGCLLTLATASEDTQGALEGLAEELDAPARAVQSEELPPLPPAPKGPLDAKRLGAVVAAAQPEGAILVDEGATSGGTWWRLAEGAEAHTTLTLTGGAIGQALPCATGAAIACPERPVIALQGDGGGLYTPQALWTQAREGLKVVTVICANRRYRILQIEMARAGVTEPGPQARRLTELTHPTVDWVQLSRSLGVSATSVDTAESLAAELSIALAEPGPRLIEALLLDGAE